MSFKSVFKYSFTQHSAARQPLIFMVI